MGRIVDAKLDQILALLTELKADVNLTRSQLLNCNLGYPLLAEGTNAGTLKTTNATTFRIAGRNYTKAATDNIAMTAAAEQAAETYCLYLVSIIADGTVTVTKGTEVATDAAVLPDLPADSAPLGFFKVVTAAATTFTSGTTDLSAAGITDSYGDLGCMNSGDDASTAIAAPVPSDLYKI